MLENSLGAVCVEGEISGDRMQPSGHQYFTLKDAKAQVACVWFAGRSSGRAVPLSDGMAVQIRGTPTVYEAQGKFQISVQSVQAAGAGLLQAKFEALKRRLQEEGLFDSGRKRALPRFPQTVALLTSPTGSVVQDMLKVLGRRAPWVRVLVYPAKVQGQGAAEEIAAGLAFLNAESGRSLPTIDVIISGRRRQHRRSLVFQRGDCREGALRLGDPSRVCSRARNRFYDIGFCGGSSCGDSECGCRDGGARRADAWQPGPLPRAAH